VEKYFRSSEYNENLLHVSLNRPKRTNESDKKADKTDEDPVDFNIPGGELYFRTKKFFKDHLEKIAKVNNNISSNKYQKNKLIIIE